MRGVDYRSLLFGRCPLFSKSIVTLNIEADNVRFLVARGKRARYWGNMPLAPGLVKDGLIADPAKVSLAIDSLLLERKVPKRRVIASVSGLRSAPRILSLPKIKSKLLGEAIQNESEREMPVPLDELYLSWQLIGARDSEHQFLVLGVPRNLLDTEVQTLAQAGIKPQVMNLKPLALARAVHREEALIIDLEPENFDLVVVVDGVPVVMRTVISRGEGVMLEDRIRQLTDELSRTVDFYNSSHPEHTLGSATPAFLTGPLADDTTACELVKAAIGNPIETLAPPFEYPASLPVAEYAVNIGLALGQALAKTAGNSATAHLPVANPNVLPQEYRPRPLSPTRILYPLAAILLLGLLFFVLWMKIGSEANIAGIQSELDSVNQQLLQMSQFVDTVNGTEAEADSLKEERESILGTGGFTDSLQYVLGSLPSGVQLTSITQTEDKISLYGDADNSSGVTSYVAALEQTGGFSTVYVASLSGSGSSTTFSIVCVISSTGATQ